MGTYSVIITTHRRPLLLPRAIRSVKEQVSVDARIILVSDIPCDETYAIASTMLDGDDIFVQRSGRPGPGESRNTGMRLLTTDFALFLDDDDALSPDFLARANNHVSTSEVVYTDFQVVFEKAGDGPPITLNRERRSLSDRRIDDIHVKNFIPASCLVYPVAALKGRSNDTSLVLNEDWDFALNVLNGFPFRYAPIDGPIIYTREQTDNRGRRNDHLLVETYLKIYRNRPAPTPALKAARQTFLASVGIEAPISQL